MSKSSKQTRPSSPENVTAGSSPMLQGEAGQDGVEGVRGEQVQMSTTSICGCLHRTECSRVKVQKVSLNVKKS